MRSQNSVQTPRITHAYRLMGPQDGKSEAASSPPGNHISDSNEASLQMVLVRKTPARIDHRNRANGESEIYAIVAAREKTTAFAPDSSTYATSIIFLHVTSLTDRESPSLNNLDEQSHTSLSTFCFHTPLCRAYYNIVILRRKAS